jgi:hypothetical protein
MVKTPRTCGETVVEPAVERVPIRAAGKAGLCPKVEVELAGPPPIPGEGGMGG